MKKNPNERDNILKWMARSKILLVMKLSLFLIFFPVFSALAIDSYSQNTAISLDLKETSIKEVLKEIEKSSEFFFLYNNDLLDVEKKVDISVKNEKIKDILDKLFEGQQVTYILMNRQIILSPKSLMESEESPQQSISGKVTDKSGQPVAGATVTVKNSNVIGTITDNEGKYILTGVSGNAILIFSFIGMKSQEIEVKGQSAINVVMEEAATELDEIIVVGYGTQKKSEVTSAIVNVKSENLIHGAVKDAVQLMQGKVAGLSISTPSGDPTTSSQFLLRGTATLATSVQPLILVDGIPGDMYAVAPEDIENIGVLKDGSAAAIYGTRGTNGVILITTKRANGEIAPSLEYNTYVSTQSFVNLPKMLTAAEYRARLAEGTAFQDLGSNTDWMKEVSRNLPVSHSHNLTIRGGNTKTNYLGTVSYRYNEGVFIKSENQTINGRFDVNHNMFDDKLKMNFNFINTDNQYSSLGDGTSFDNTIFRNAFIRNPTAPIKNPDGTWFEQPGIAYYENPVSLLNESTGQNQSQTTRLSGNVTWEPVTGLRLKALVSRSKFNNVYGYSESKNNISTIRDNLNGLAIKSNAQSVDRLMELTAEYSKSIEFHNFSALAGYSYQDNVYEYGYMKNYDFPAGNFSYADNIGVGMALGAGKATLSSSKTASNLIGFFGRITYNYKEKYLLMASLRYEGSSKFVGTNNAWGMFPSVSVGWRINKENFMKDIKFLDDLKIRAGYGVTGTAPDALFLGLSRMGYTQGSFLINGAFVPSLGPISNDNPYLKWEVKKETNFGLDFSILKGLISGNIDYYIRRTEGLLYDYQVPSPPNLFTTTTANVGVMKNNGLEILLNFVPVHTNKFDWKSGISFSTNKNVLASLSNDLYQVTNDFINVGYTGSPVQTYTHRIQVGEPIGNFYGYKVVDITSDGNWLYEDKNGNSVLLAARTEADKKILGNGLPKFYAGWNNNFRFGNLDLSITMRGAFKYQILDFQRMYYELPGFTLYNQLSSSYDKVFGKAVLNKTVMPDFNSYYVENGDFWKIDNVTVGYNFDLSKVKHISSAYLYFSSLNTLCFTKYKGMDPEVNRLGLYPGLDDRDKYPSVRVLTLGLKLTIK